MLENFNLMLPVLREAVVYLNKAINNEFMAKHKDKFKSILSAYYMHLPFVNLWLAHLLRNQGFSEVDIPESYDDIISTRDKALIALRCQDLTWIKGFRDGIDLLGPWDKRAILYFSSLLSLDEMKAWASAVGESGDIVDRSIATYLISQKKSSK